MSLSSAELVRVAIHLLPIESQFFQKGTNAFFVFLIVLCQTMLTHRFPNDSGHCHSWVKGQVWILKNNLRRPSEHLQLVALERHHVLVIKRYPAEIRLEESQNQMTYSSLPEAALAHKP